MASNTQNIPDLLQMLKVEFNPQVLYDTLIDLKTTITELEKRVKELEDENDS